MVHSFRHALLVGAASLTMTNAAFAQEQSVRPNEQTQPDAESLSGGNDIVVTARRRSETLQDVPQTVNAVSSETIEKLRINNASDIAQIVPGISIEGSSTGSGGFGSSSSIRGVPTFLLSNATPVVQFYLNDAPTGRGPEVTQSLFDIGQIEVLKGPQGTLRGRSAPTGAITITSRRPDLGEVGGFANLSGTDLGNINAQAAIGLPLIRDVLALRVAAMIDHNDGNGVTSANYRAAPFTRSEAVRGTLRFEPTSSLSASVMYQRLWRKSASFTQVMGPGNGRNGPAIAAGDRLGITDRPNQSNAVTDFVVGQIEWRFAGQKLTYVGSYRKGSSTARAPQDIANVIRGVEYFQDTSTPAGESSHELRLSSEERVAGIFDYTLGGFYDREYSHPTVSSYARFLSGAFGRPGQAPAEVDPNSRYALRTAIAIDPVVTEKSVFGNVTAHLGNATEFSVGGRYIDFQRRDSFSLNLLGGFNALSNPTGGFLPCAALGNLSAQLRGAVASPVYTGSPSVCDLPIPGAQLQNVNRREKFTPFVYNFALSHKFSPDFMVYANVGSAFRTAGPAIGLTSALNCCAQAGGTNLGTIEDLVFHKPEKSKTYEMGFKSSFLDRRVRLNVSLFQQDFKNFFFLTQPTRYLSITDPANPAGAGSAVSSSEFTADADARVRGVDVEAGFQVTPKWNVNLGFSWSKAKLNNAVIPCNDSNFDGIVDAGVPTVQTFISAGVMVARCRSNDSISRTPLWNLTAQSEYATPVSASVDGFVRGNFNYYPDNPNASQGVVIDTYSLLNMYLGLRAANNGWEVSLFANNLLNTKQVLSINSVAPVSSGSPINFFPQGAAGYNQISYTPRREFGLAVRFAFGSR